MSTSPWRNRSFVALWLAQISSNIGDQFYSIALLWYLLQQTKSVALLSTIAIPEMLAGLIFYLVGGVLADRYNPKKIMIAADIARLGLALCIGSLVLFQLDHFLMFLIVQFFVGVCSTLFNPSRTVALKAIVPVDSLGQANAIFDTTFRTIRILAPMTIGVLAAYMPIAFLFFINAVSYFISAICIYALRQPLMHVTEAPTTALTPALYVNEIKTAVKEVIKKQVVLYVILFSNMGYLVWQVCWSVGFPVLADQLGHGDAGMLGVLIGFYGVGNLLGSLFMTRLIYRNYLFVILMGWLFQATGFTLIPLLQDHPTLIYACASISGFGGPLTGIPVVTAIQTKINDVNTGKVFALHMLTLAIFGIFSSSLGALWLASWSIQQLFMISGLFLFGVVGLGFILDRRLRNKMNTTVQ